MQQPPLIDVEPEEGSKFWRLVRKVFLFVLFLLIVIIFVFLTWFTPAGEGELASKSGNGTNIESVEKEEKGFKGMLGKLGKLARSIKGGGSASKGEAIGEQGLTGGGAGQAAGKSVENSVTKSAAESASLALSAGGEGSPTEERNRVLKEKFGHLEEGGLAGRGRQAGDSGKAPKNTIAAAGGEPTSAAGSGTKSGTKSEVKAAPQLRKRRGGSFGTSTGVATPTGANNQYRRWKGNFGTLGSDLQFEVIYQETGGQIQFRCFVIPYDAQTAKLFNTNKGDILLSFHDKSGRKRVPADLSLNIPLTRMTAYQSQGVVAGWVARGTIPLGEQKFSEMTSVRLGWDFDALLSDWLKDVKANRGY